MIHFQSCELFRVHVALGKVRCNFGLIVVVWPSCKSLFAAKNTYLFHSISWLILRRNEQSLFYVSCSQHMNDAAQRPPSIAMAAHVISTITALVPPMISQPPSLPEWPQSLRRWPPPLPSLKHSNHYSYHHNNNLIPITTITRTTVLPPSLIFSSLSVSVTVITTLNNDCHLSWYH